MGASADYNFYNWQSMTSTQLPPANAVWGGYVYDSGDCFVCRAKVKSDTLVGKLCNYGGWKCFVGNTGTEQSFNSYEVMINP
jgi:hypothetical protein